LRVRSRSLRSAPELERLLIPQPRNERTQYVNLDPCEHQGKCDNTYSEYDIRSECPSGSRHHDRSNERKGDVDRGQAHRQSALSSAHLTGHPTPPFSAPPFVLIFPAVPPVPGPPADADTGHDQDPAKYRDRPGVTARGQPDPNEREHQPRRQPAPGYPDHEVLPTNFR